MIIFGITGTLGAGKGTIVEYLTGEKSFLHFSVRAFLLDEIRRRHLPENRDSMFSVANDLRAEHGSSWITDQLYLQALKAGKNCVIESIRTTGEIASLRTKGNFTLIAVDASAEIRYRRVILRGSETDRITYETFLEDEEREMNTQDPNKQNLKRCIDEADFILLNNGTREELLEQVNEILALKKITS